MGLSPEYSQGAAKAHQKFPYEFALHKDEDPANPTADQLQIADIGSSSPGAEASTLETWAAPDGTGAMRHLGTEQEYAFLLETALWPQEKRQAYIVFSENVRAFRAFAQTGKEIEENRRVVLTPAFEITYGIYATKIGEEDNFVTIAARTDEAEDAEHAARLRLTFSFSGDTVRSVNGTLNEGRVYQSPKEPERPITFTHKVQSLPARFAQAIEQFTWNAMDIITTPAIPDVANETYASLADDPLYSESYYNTNEGILDENLPALREAENILAVQRQHINSAIPGKPEQKEAEAIEEYIEQKAAQTVLRNGLEALGRVCSERCLPSTSDNGGRHMQTVDGSTTYTEVPVDGGYISVMQLKPHVLMDGEQKLGESTVTAIITGGQLVHVLYNLIQAEFPPHSLFRQDESGNYINLNNVPLQVSPVIARFVQERLHMLTDEPASSEKQEIKATTINWRYLTKLLLRYYNSEHEDTIGDSGLAAGNDAVEAAEYYLQMPKKYQDYPFFHKVLTLLYERALRRDEFNADTCSAEELLIELDEPYRALFAIKAEQNMSTRNYDLLNKNLQSLLDLARSSASYNGSTTVRNGQTELRYTQLASGNSGDATSPDVFLQLQDYQDTAAGSVRAANAVELYFRDGKVTEISVLLSKDFFEPDANIHRNNVQYTGPLQTLQLTQSQFAEHDRSIDRQTINLLTTALTRYTSERLSLLQNIAALPQDELNSTIQLCRRLIDLSFEPGVTRFHSGVKATVDPLLAGAQIEVGGLDNAGRRVTSAARMTKRYMKIALTGNRGHLHIVESYMSGATSISFTAIHIPDGAKASQASYFVRDQSDSPNDGQANRKYEAGIVIPDGKQVDPKHIPDVTIYFHDMALLQELLRSITGSK